MIPDAIAKTRNVKAIQGHAQRLVAYVPRFRGGNMVTRPAT